MWHYSSMKYLKCLVVTTLAMVSFASEAALAADLITFSGKIAGVDGQQIADATVSVNNNKVTVTKDGTYAVSTERKTTYRIDVDAPGHYEFIHAFSRADLNGSDDAHSGFVVPPIVLVRRKDDRRLLVFAGDTMMGRRYVAPRSDEPILIRAESVSDDTRSILRNMKPYFELADFASVNLETQLSNTPLTEPLPKSVTFYSSEETAEALSWAGVDYVALGNNHMFDYGPQGLSQTLAALNRSGLSYSGAGESDVAARKPALTDASGQPISLSSYLGWAGNFQPNQVAEYDKGGAALGTHRSIVQDLHAVPDDVLSVFQYHSGLEYVSYAPMAEETRLKSAIRAGADIAIGHHSHVFQGFEVYDGKLLAYSLGNFAFDQYLYSTQSAILLFAWYDGDDFYRAEIVPLHINGYIPTPATGLFRYDILQRLVRLSDPRSVCWSNSGEHATFQKCSDGAAQAEPQKLEAPSNTRDGGVQHVAALGADPLRTIHSVVSDSPYRLGVDLLRRGDFEYAGLFDTHDRTWIEDRRVTIIDDDSMLMAVTVPAGEEVTTGMKAFTRVFSRSAPATVAGRVRSTGCSSVAFTLQRRLDRVGLEEALDSGPITEIGTLEAITQDWQKFAIDFDLPRTSTKSIRLLATFSNCNTEDSAALVKVDDLSLVEWQTPWMHERDAIPNPNRAQTTHIQYSSTAAQ